MNEGMTELNRDQDKKVNDRSAALTGHMFPIVLDGQHMASRLGRSNGQRISAVVVVVQLAKGLLRRTHAVDR